MQLLVILMKNLLTNNINSRDIKSPIREEYFAKHILWQLNGPHPTQSPIIVEDAIFFGISRIFVGQNLVKVCGTTVQYSFQPDVYLCNMSDQKSRGPVGVWGSGQAPAPSLQTTNSHQENGWPLTPSPPFRCAFSGYLTKFRGSSSHFLLDHFSLQIFTQPSLFQTDFVRDLRIYFHSLFPNNLSHFPKPVQYHFAPKYGCLSMYLRILVLFLQMSSKIVFL